MYDELVNRLRSEAVYLPEKFSKNAELLDVLMKAADAIEDLEFACNRYEKDYKALCEYLPKWIPVTERLPEEVGKYLVCGRWKGKQTEIWVCEFMTLGCLKGWANNAVNPSVSHWMPLPEPPKEET